MPRKGGRRCVVGGCSNSALDGYTVYTVNVMDDSVRRQWIRFIQTTRSNFDHKNAKSMYVCDGHFTEDAFNKSQKMQFLAKTRSKAPELDKLAVPSVKVSTPPHFQRSSAETQPPQPATSPNNYALARAPDGDILYTPISKTQVGLSLETLPSSSGPGSHGSGQRAKKRRRSQVIAQKEIIAIQEEYEVRAVPHTETDCKAPGCTQPHSAPTQTEPLVRHQQCQSDSRLSEPNKKPYKHKKIQFKYKTHHKATQTPDQPVNATCVCRCSSQLAPVLISTETQYEEQPPPLPLPADEDDDDDISEISDGGDDSNDPDWEMLEDEDDLSEGDDSGTEEQYLSETASPAQQPKYLVFESNLMALFQFCPSRECGAPCNITLNTAKSFGSMLQVHQECTMCDFTRTWNSQPTIGNTPAGNILLSSAILFAGASPTKVVRVLRHLNVKGICQNTFLNHQKLYLQPAVVSSWKEQQAALIQDLKEKGEPLVIGGDGRCDSPGHSAKYGTYTFMDLNSGKVIDIQLVQSTEVANSNAMELEGLKRGLEFLKSQGLTIATLITDRHPSITKWMREKNPEIEHLFDVWHIAKSVKKKLTALSKLKGCEDVALWQKSIINHLYWSATSTPNGDGQLMAAKFHSLTNHLKNTHNGHGEHDEFDECAHGALEPRTWLKEDSKAYDKICEVITKKHLTRGLKQMSPLEQTSSVEAFHGVMCLWAPKLLAFSYTGMKCRSFLSAVHWNENGNRDQASTSDGTLQYSICYPKQKPGGYSVKKVLTALTYGYVDVLTEQVVKLAEKGDKKLRETIPELKPMEPLCSKFERPDKATAVRQHHERGRFAARVQ